MHFFKLINGEAAHQLNVHSLTTVREWRYGLNSVSGSRAKSVATNVGVNQFVTLAVQSRTHTLSRAVPAIPQLKSVVDV